MERFLDLSLGAIAFWLAFLAGNMLAHMNPAAPSTFFVAFGLYILSRV